jgi:hypothetical protein
MHILSPVLLVLLSQLVMVGPVVFSSIIAFLQKQTVLKGPLTKMVKIDHLNAYKYS